MSRTPLTKGIVNRRCARKAAVYLGSLACSAQYAVSALGGVAPDDVLVTRLIDSGVSLADLEYTFKWVVVVVLKFSIRSRALSHESSQSSM